MIRSSVVVYDGPSDAEQWVDVHGICMLVSVLVLATMTLAH